MIELNIGNKNIIYSDSYLSVINKADRFFYAIFDDQHTIKEASLEPVNFSTIERLILRGCNRHLIAIDSPSIHLPINLSGDSFLEEFTTTLPNSSFLKDNMIGNVASTHYALPRIKVDTLYSTVEYNDLIHMSTVIADYQYPAIKDKVLAVIGDNYLYLSHHNQEGLRFINRYRCDSTQDYVYYLNLCFSQLNLDFIETNLEVCGQLKKNSPLSIMLSDYFGNWSFSDPILLNIEDHQKGVEKHWFHELYMVYLCAL